MKNYIRLIGILLFIFILMKINFGDVWASLAEADALLLLLICALNLAVVAFRALRWIKLLEIQGIEFNFPGSFWAYSRSLYLGNVTPGRVGELSRVHYLMKYVDTNSAVATSSVIFDRVLDTYFILIMGMIGLMASNVWVQYEWIKYVFLVCMLLIPVFLFVPNFSLSFIKILPNFWEMRTRAKNWLENFFKAIKCFLTKKITPSVFITAIIYLIFFLQCILIAFAIDLKIDLFYLVLCVVIFSALSVLPISFSNMGTREYSLIFMFQYVSLSPELAVSYSLLFFVTINLFLALFGWLVYVFYKDKSATMDISNNSVNNLYKDQSVIK